VSFTLERGQAAAVTVTANVLHTEEQAASLSLAASSQEPAIASVAGLEAEWIKRIVSWRGPHTSELADFPPIRA
jgi:hypothetical protein